MKKLFSGKARHARTEEKPSNSARLLYVVMLLVLVKLYYASTFLTEDSTENVAEMLRTEVAAQEQQQLQQEQPGPAPDNASRQWDIKEDFSWSYDLVLALQKRDEELRIKEEALKKKEERISHLIRDLETRIDELQVLEKGISGLIDQKKAVENEKVRKLAKVFEETPPEQAGPLMSKLDVDIAAQLLLKMTGRKAGRIWGYVDPDQAVRISKELARIQPGFTLDGMNAPDQKE